jgi:hypothetical protein
VFFGVSVVRFLPDQDLFDRIRRTCPLCLPRPARLPAAAPAELCADSYQQATTAVQAAPFTPRRALEQPVRPGAVVTLGQATASAGTSITTVRQSGSPGFAQTASLAGRAKQTRQNALSRNPLRNVPPIQSVLTYLYICRIP